MGQLNFFEPIEDQIKPASGNKNLINWGIQNEESDYRVHVGYKSQHICVYPTAAGQKYLATDHGLPLKKVYQNGIHTANGYAVPISHIPGLISILIPVDIYQRYIIHEDMTTSYMGILATSITKEMLERSLIPLPVEVDLTEDKALQVSGTDIIIHSKLKLQVKCDFRAGPRSNGGTGNVFLQVAECNPYKRH